LAELTAIIFAPSWGEPTALASLAVECARVGASAVRLPDADPAWTQAAAAAITAATDLTVLGPDYGPRLLRLGPNPIAQLHEVLGEAADIVVAGPLVSALLAGLAAGTHLQAGSADTPGERSTRAEVQLVARAAALARLAGRPPMTPADFRARWPT
jgi:hypothetical protein